MNEILPEGRGAQFSLRGMIITMAAICGTMAIVGALNIPVIDILIGFGLMTGLALVMIGIAEAFNVILRRRGVANTPPQRLAKFPPKQVDWIQERSEQLAERRQIQDTREHDSSGGDPV